MRTNLNTRAKRTRGPMARQTIGPATLGQNSAPLEGYSTTSRQIRLARGVDHPIERGSVSLKGRTTLERDSASLEGWTPPPPRASPRLDREPNAPSIKSPSRSRASRATAPIPAPPAGAFNALTPACVQVKGKSTPLHAWESCPGTAPPTPLSRPLLRRLPATVRRCAARSATAPRHCTTHSRTASALRPRKRTMEPSKGRCASTLRPHGTAP
jgi:hypothetical protein